MARYQELDELEVYRLATALADATWGAASGWRPFARDTAGKQLVRAADSVAANIAESFGRYHYSDRVNSLYYARGSLYESKHWLTRSQVRGPIADEAYTNLVDQVNTLAPKLNAFIRAKKQQRQRSKPPSGKVTK